MKKFTKLPAIIVLAFLIAFVSINANATDDTSTLNLQQILGIQPEAEYANIDLTATEEGSEIMATVEDPSKIGGCLKGDRVKLINLGNGEWKITRLANGSGFNFKVYEEDSLMKISKTETSWKFGIGTGLFNLHVEGDIGIHTNIAGPVEFDVELDPDDIDDLLESAFGFGGFVTDGKWMITYSFTQLKLEGDDREVLANGSTVSAEIGFDITGGELTVGYPVYRGTSLNIRLLAGARYTKHELESDITVDSGIGTIRLKTDIDEDWTDALFGISVDVPFTEKWIWSNRFDAGYGGSEGTYNAYTGLTWRFYKYLSTTLYGRYTAVEFENGDKGDTDWYLYDADEYGVGLSIFLTW
jgi:hypothetical protein